MTNCPLCDLRELNTDELRAIQMCGECARKLGVIEMPPALRSPTPCAKCQGRRFTRIIPREHSLDSHATRQNQVVGAPMLATHAPSTYVTWGGRAVENPNIKVGYGLLEMYACWGCGFVEWYCRDVARIPIHPHLMTELIDLDASGPHR